MSQYTYKRELNLVCAQRLPPGRCALESHPGTRNLAPERLAKTNAPPACQIQNRARIQSCVRWPNGSPRPLPSESHPGTQQSGTGSPSWRPRTSSWRASYFGSHTDAARPPPRPGASRSRKGTLPTPDAQKREIKEKEMAAVSPVVHHNVALGIEVGVVQLVDRRPHALSQPRQ